MSMLKISHCRLPAGARRPAGDIYVCMYEFCFLTGQKTHGKKLARVSFCLEVQQCMGKNVAEALHVNIHTDMHAHPGSQLHVNEHPYENCIASR